ncbi:MAG: hypothetical protein NVS3B5_04770 [Sphingomicrobium sp.]
MVWTKKQALVTSTADGKIEILAMRYNASHGRGWRCFLDEFAEDPATISEETEPSFHGRSLFQALAAFRVTIEPMGGRLLQMTASRDCWEDPGTFDRFCRRGTPGSTSTELVDGFLPIGMEESVTLDEQRASYEAWRASLPVVSDVGDALQSRGRRALDQTNASILAARDAAILARGDLASGDGSDPVRG